MKKILGLDLGTNSIGWAVMNADVITRDNGTTYLKPVQISCAGSRIIPMSEDILGNFDRGNSISQTAERTGHRMMRRIHERYLLRRERMLRILKIMGFLPKHFSEKINKYGKFATETEPKLPWCDNEKDKKKFLFMDSFNEMLADFAKHQPILIEKNKKIPYDWTIYYLRKKALTQRITKEELAWILLQFNQKRGYYQLRGEEEEENADENTEIISGVVLSVEKGDKDKKTDKYWYKIHLDNGKEYEATFYNEPSDWLGMTKDFIQKTTIRKDGSSSYKLSFLPSMEEIESMPEKQRNAMYAKIKLRTEKKIDESNETLGCFIYDAILHKPSQKIIGQFVRTVERRYYKDELKKILEVQQQFIPELRDEALYERCVEELYPNNEAHRNSIAKPDFINLFVNDILFYQRPLKTKKSLIDDCPYEVRWDKNGEPHPVKCIAKSNPYFQEFRLWQFVSNLRIYQREKIVSDGQLNLFDGAPAGKLQTDVDVTQEFLKSDEDRVNLYEWLNDREKIKQDTLLNSYFKIKKAKGQTQYPYRWNYVEDKEYLCNETRAAILSGLEKSENSSDFLTYGVEIKLWHILYSIEDKEELVKALRNFAKDNGLNDRFAEVFCKLKPFKKEYGAYSEKAIKKLLPLMRMGKYWKEDNIDANTLQRIDKIITGEYDEQIKNRVREKSINLTDVSHYKGLPVWLACYIVYDRHSEAKEIEKWKTPDDIERYLMGFKQHSLRNPIVEQVITETLRTVRDIWKQEGQIDEIHVELGREMKNPADIRRDITQKVLKNENTNQRIKAMLKEFMNPELNIENVRPYSPSQQDILRIYEENALLNLSKEDKDFEFVSKVSKMAVPSKSDIIRYKCWLEQKYRSPYTGNMIPLAKLFTPAYEIEHIIPQSRYFDDSFSNKVICESEVNKLKDRLLGHEFIVKHHGEKLSESVKIFSVEEYEDFVKTHYAKSPKMEKLLLDDIPDKFIERQMNDTRYISKVVKGLLSNVVREQNADGEYEQEAVSKNLISCNGSITDKLKRDWGMNDVWNHIVLPRFERMNALTQTKDYTTTNREGHIIPNTENLQGINKKRIDHRHHAMDAIVIACATRDHVNLLNNEAAHSKHNANRYQLQRKLRRYEKVMIDGKEREIAKEFLMPWEGFVVDAQMVLENIIVSFKQNLRVINKTTNYYQHYNRNGKKETTEQKNGDSWAIRKSMHKETVFGEINLRRKKTVSLNEALKQPERIVNKDFKKKVIELLKDGKDAKYIKKYLAENSDVWSDVNPTKIELYYFTKDEKKRNGEPKERYFAVRKSLDTSFNRKKIEEQIADTGIQKILLAHLQLNGDDPQKAFSPEGIEEMNRNIVSLNNGKFHQPILKVRQYEKADKFAVGQTGNKAKKFVEAAKGTNLFFAILGKREENVEIGDGRIVRSYFSIPLNVVIDCQKLYGKEWRDNLEKYLKEKCLIDSDVELLFTLSPNDLVYLPKEGESYDDVSTIDKNRIYKFVNPDGQTANFIHFAIAKPVFSMNFVDQKKNGINIPIQNEIGIGSRGSKNPRAFTGEMIKETCIPIKVDRLGNIIEFNGMRL